MHKNEVEEIIDQLRKADLDFEDFEILRQECAILAMVRHAEQNELYD